jgi:hypothetical protein
MQTIPTAAQLAEQFGNVSLDPAKTETHVPVPDDVDRFLASVDYSQILRPRSGSPVER